MVTGYSDNYIKVCLVLTNLQIFIFSLEELEGWFSV